MGQLRAKSAGTLRAPPVAVLLVILTLVPTLAMLAVAGQTAGQRWERHMAAEQVRRDASAVRSLAKLQAAVTDETIDSGASVAATELGLDGTVLRELLGFDPAVEMAAARATVDDAPSPVDAPDLVRDIDALRRLRQSIDAGTSSWEAVAAFQRTFRQHMATALNEELALLELHAGAAGDTGELSDAVDATHLLLLAFRQASQRLDTASQVVERPLSSEDQQDLAEVDATFDLTMGEARRLVGSRAASASDDLLGAATSERFNSLVTDLRTNPATAEGPRPGGDLLDYGRALRDGATWLISVNAVLEASAEDVVELATDRDRAATTALRNMAVAIGLVLLCTVATTLAVARVMVRAATRLVDVARRIAQGDYHAGTRLGRPKGPREVHAIHEAVADVTHALSALEVYVSDLADDPTSVTLDRPLPGATGQALQRTVDRLRAALKLDEETRARLAEVAAHDALTGLLNRGAGLTAIEHELGEDRRAGQAGVIALLFIDLDGLKDINDRHGHAAGDAALRLAADALRWATRRADIVARMGGDEFVVLLHAPDAAAVDALAERVHVALAARPLVLGDVSVPIGCSVGIALAETHEGAHDVLRHADAALYRAKAGGRGRVAWHQPLGSTPAGHAFSSEIGDLLP